MPFVGRHHSLRLPGYPVSQLMRRRHVHLDARLRGMWTRHMSLGFESLHQLCVWALLSQSLCCRYIQCHPCKIGQCTSRLDGRKDVLQVEGVHADIWRSAYPSGPRVWLQPRWPTLVYSLPVNVQKHLLASHSSPMSIGGNGQISDR